VEVEGVEPTNNAAERALRHGVLWRKVRHGPKSVKGYDFLNKSAPYDPTKITGPVWADSDNSDNHAPTK
jgi:hypothetical protein